MDGLSAAEDRVVAWSRDPEGRVLAVRRGSATTRAIDGPLDDVFFARRLRPGDHPHRSPRHLVAVRLHRPGRAQRP